MRVSCIATGKARQRRVVGYRMKMKDRSEDYDKRLVAVKFLKVLCRKGILPGEVMEKLILRERKLMKEDE